MRNYPDELEEGESLSNLAHGDDDDSERKWTLPQAQRRLNAQVIYVAIVGISMLVYLILMETCSQRAPAPTGTMLTEAR